MSKPDFREVSPQELAAMPAARAATAQPDIIATVQQLFMEPGVYSVEVIADQAMLPDAPMLLPCIRIESLPTSPSAPGHANVFGAAENGWIWRREHPAYAIVVGGRAPVIMTIYRGNGMAAPEVRIRYIPTEIGATNATASTLMPVASDGTVPMMALAHITRVGDVAENAGGWIGKADGGRPIEGFQLTPSGGVRPEEIEYQAIMGINWDTPWFDGGAYCGSRGLQLPLLGFRVRLKVPDSEYECAYSGRFVGGEVSGPHRDNEACQAGDRPLEAMQVVIRRKAETAMALPSADLAALAPAASTAKVDTQLREPDASDRFARSKPAGKERSATGKTVPKAAAAPTRKKLAKAGVA